MYGAAARSVPASNKAVESMRMPPAESAPIQREPVDAYLGAVGLALTLALLVLGLITILRYL